MLKKRVKAGSVTHLTDARYFAAWDVEFIGFCFDPESSDYISPQDALAIKGWLSGVQFVAEFAGQDEENIRNIISYLEPDVIELDATYPISLAKSLHNEGHTIAWRGSWHDQPAETDELAYLLVTEIPTGASLSPKHMTDLSQQPDIDHDLVQLKGSPEAETGIKNYDDVGALLESWEI